MLGSSLKIAFCYQDYSMEAQDGPRNGESKNQHSAQRNDTSIGLLTLSGEQESMISKIIDGWTTQTFLISQGTGVLAVVLHDLDWQFHGSQIISIIVWIITIVIYILFLFTYVIKVFVNPNLVRKQLDSDIVELCCLASISITLGVITDMVALVCAQAWGPSWGLFAYVLSWIHVGIAFVANLGIPYKYFASEPPGIDGMPPNVVLPSIAGVTAAATCGVVAFAGNLSSRTQVPMIITGYVSLGIGLPFSFIITAVYITHLISSGLPPRAQNPTNWILVGPLGQAAYACQILGAAAASPGKESFASYGRGYFLTENSGETVSSVSILASLVLWGYATFWIIFSLVATLHLECFTQGGLKKSKYNLSYWSPIFPIGVYTLATIEFGKSMNAPAWDALSSGFVCSSSCHFDMTISRNF